MIGTNLLPIQIAEEAEKFEQWYKADYFAKRGKYPDIRTYQRIDGYPFYINNTANALWCGWFAKANNP